MKPVEMGYNQKCQVKSGFYIFFNQGNSLKDFLIGRIMQIMPSKKLCQQATADFHVGYL